MDPNNLSMREEVLARAKEIMTGVLSRRGTKTTKSNESFRHY